MNFDMRAFAADLCRFASTAGEEAAAADFVEGELDALGFETYAWDADPNSSPITPPSRTTSTSRTWRADEASRACSRSAGATTATRETTPPRSL